MVLDRIHAMLQAADEGHAPFPPTIFFNENWLLRIVLDWFSGHNVGEPSLTFADGARWFSEALLPSAFLPRHRGDPLAESWTHADGVIGHFEIGASGKGDLGLLPGASQFVVLEGKVFSRLSAGVKNARYFDQAARNVACIAEVLHRAGCQPKGQALGFYVLAPDSQIRAGVFAAEVDAGSIRQKVQRRVSEYEGERDEWLAKWFLPALERTHIGCVGWENVIATITKADPKAGEAVNQFYQKCLQFNRPS